jgi:hypothetical protein
MEHFAGTKKLPETDTPGSPQSQETSVLEAIWWSKIRQYSSLNQS